VSQRPTFVVCKTGNGDLSTKKVNTLRIDKHKNSFESDLLYFQKKTFRTIINDTFNYTL